MSGGAESSMLPSLQSDISTLSAPKSREIARNGSESASFSSVLDGQSRPNSPPPGPSPSTKTQSKDADRGNPLPPEAANSAASGTSAEASQAISYDATRLVAELSATSANAEGESLGSQLSEQLVAPTGNSQLSAGAPAVSLSDELALTENSRLSVVDLLSRTERSASLLTASAGSSSATLATVGDSSANRAVNLALGRAAVAPDVPALRQASVQASTASLLDGSAAGVQQESAISSANSSLVGIDRVSKYSQTKATEFVNQGAILSRDAALDAGDVSFDAMLLRQGRAITPSETIDRMLALNARQDGQPAISTASATGAAALAAGHAVAPSPAGHQTTGTGGVAEQFALYHSPAEPEFAEEFTARVQMMAKDGLREARLQLHPAELGRLQVSVTTEGDQARVTFVAETSSARDLIEQNLPRLREMLEEQGLQLAQSDVGQRDSEALAEQDARDASNAINELQQDDETDAELAPAVLAYATATSRIDIHV